MEQWCSIVGRISRMRMSERVSQTQPSNIKVQIQLNPNFIADMPCVENCRHLMFIEKMHLIAAHSSKWDRKGANAFQTISQTHECERERISSDLQLLLLTFSSLFLFDFHIAVIWFENWEREKSDKIRYDETTNMNTRNFHIESNNKMVHVPFASDCWCLAANSTVRPTRDCSTRPNRLNTFRDPLRRRPHANRHANYSNRIPNAMCYSLAAGVHGIRISVARTYRCIRCIVRTPAPWTNTNRACKCLRICRSNDAPPWMWWHLWRRADAPDDATVHCTSVRHWCAWSGPMSWRLRAEFWPPWIDSIVRACTVSRKCVNRRKCDWFDRHRNPWAHCSALVESTNAFRRPVRSNRSVCPRVSFRRGRHDRCRRLTKSVAIFRAVAAQWSFHRWDQVNGVLFSWRSDMLRRLAMSPVLANFSLHCLGTSWAHYANVVSQTRSFCIGGGFKRFSRTKKKNKQNHYACTHTHSHSHTAKCEFLLFIYLILVAVSFCSMPNRAANTRIRWFVSYLFIYLFTLQSKHFGDDERDRNVCDAIQSNQWQMQDNQNVSIAMRWIDVERATATV